MTQQKPFTLRELERFLLGEESHHRIENTNREAEIALTVCKTSSHKHHRRPLPLYRTPQPRSTSPSAPQGLDRNPNCPWRRHSRKADFDWHRSGDHWRHCGAPNHWTWECPIYKTEERIKRLTVRLQDLRSRASSNQAHSIHTNFETDNSDSVLDVDSLSSLKSSDIFS